MNRLTSIAWQARLGLALVFAYHGMVPKILWLSPQEVAMIQAHGWGAQAFWLAPLAGGLEIALAAALLLFRRRLWPLATAAAVLLVLLVDVALFSPAFLIQAFNPVSSNLAALCLCWIAWKAESSQVFYG
ncbi:MAG: DoxX-like family protein [Pseudomonadota bacterium]